jgi:hypothetical protein
MNSKLFLLLAGDAYEGHSILGVFLDLNDLFQAIKNIEYDYDEVGYIEACPNEFFDDYLDRLILVDQS